METEADLAEGGLAARVVAAKRPMEAADPRDAAQEKALSKVSSEVLAAELQRRGWIVMEP